MLRRALLLFVVLMLGGCAGSRVPRGGETISYVAGRCFGTCPAYAVTLGPDGQGIFVGQANTAVTGERRFSASPEQVRAFTASLARVRPAGTENVIFRNCEQTVTDAPDVRVRWQGAGGGATLVFNFGCQGRQGRKMAATLRAVPNLLPIGDLIGAR